MQKEVAPFADIWEKNRIVPKEMWKKMGAQGFLCPEVPKQYGGAGLDFLYSVIIIEELISTRQFGLLTPLHSDVVVPYITTYGSEALKQKYLPHCVSGDMISAIGLTEPNAGSDLASLGTTAVQKGDHVVINGQKTFISNGINCDIIVLAARDPDVENPHAAIDLYLAETATKGFQQGVQLSKMGWHSQDTAELYFNNLKVPITSRLGEKGGGFLMLMGMLQQERLVCAVSAQVMAECILKTTIEFCKSHKISGRPIIKNQSTQFKIVNMATEVKLGRTFIDKLIADHLEMKNIVIDVSMAKAWVTEMASRIANDCMDLYGDFGYLEKHPIERYWRDIRVMSIFAGTNEIMRSIAAKFMGL